MVAAVADLALLDLARLLGGEIQGGQVLAPGPGHSRKDRSLAVRLERTARDGFIFYSFSGDAPAACRTHILTSLKLQPNYRPAPTRCKPNPEVLSTRTRGTVAASQVTWRNSQNVSGSLGEYYLATRGLQFDGGIAGALRFHPALPLNGVFSPALVALFRDIRTDAPCGIQRTWLSRNGRKLERKMLGRVKNAAIKIDPNEEVTLALTIGEGLETALAARQLDCGPAWAVGSAMAIQTFPVLAGVETLRILAEHDDAGANARAIEAVAMRWLKAGREVFVFDPPHGDMNDVLIERGHG